MEKEEWRGRFKRGDWWRSTQPTTCGICGCKSNLWQMAGGMTFGPRLVCPGRTKFDELHETLEEKIDAVDDGVLPKSVIVELREEIKEIRDKFAKEVKPDTRFPKQKIERYSS
jgi:hypothetical protein